MARWLLLALAVLLQTVAGPGGRGGAGAARYSDYSAARMPQYDSVNYDAQVASSADEGYRDRSEDFPAPVDYNYEQTNDKRNLNEENSWQRDNSGTESTHAVTDYEDSDYSNEKMGDTFIRNKYSNKNREKRIRSKIKEDNIFAPRSKLQRPNSYEQSALDDEEVEVSSERGKDLDTDSEKGKFVRRDIRQNVRDKAREHKAAVRSGNEYRDQSDYRPGKSEINADSRHYPEEESPHGAPHRQMGDGRPKRLPPRLPAYRASDDKDLSPNQLAGRYRAPMPKPKKTLNDYVDYNDKSRIEKIKSLSARSSTVRSTEMRHWLPQDDFRRSYQGKPPAPAGKLDQPKPSHAAVTTTVSQTITPIQMSSEVISPLPKEVIQNITAFLNKTKQLSIAQKELSLAEKSQLSILKKAQRRDNVMDMLKDKPPVLLQVTESMQTVVMVEPPVSQEPWLRARDLAEDSPERIERVKRFMRNKLVANARNISELMDNWDDTICDFVDITMLEDNNSARSGYTGSLNQIMIITYGVFLCTKHFIHNL